MAKLRVGILGATGYGGSELLRLLLLHPRTEVRLATSRRRAGARVDEIHPNLRGMTDLDLTMPEPGPAWSELDCLFSALPHGESRKILPRLCGSSKVIDLAADFRLEDGAGDRRLNGGEHGGRDFQDGFVYGLSEINRSRIAASDKVANPGCFATAVLLGLYPLVSRKRVEHRIVVDAKTGSSGSGAEAKPGTHHPRRSGSFIAYKPFRHQHLAEIDQTLREADPDWPPSGLILQTHSAPLVRGIFATVYCRCNGQMDEDELGRLYQEAYGASPFVRLVEGSPDVHWVKNSNYADIGWALQGRDLIVFVAIDNLMKGAAGQAVQNMNLMYGFPEASGLQMVGGNP